MKQQLSITRERSYSVFTTLFLVTLFAFLFTVQQSSAQIVAWQFGSPQSLGSEAMYSATTNDANLNTSILERGSGITAPGLQRGFGGGGWNVPGTKDSAIISSEYFTFSIKANSGYAVSLSTLDVRLRRTGTGPNSYRWRYSTDGTNFSDLGSDSISNTSIVDGVDQPQINLSGFGALQNVSSATTITFRLYAWNSTGSAGTFGIGRYSTGITTNSLSIGGSVAITGGASLNATSTTLTFGSQTVFTNSVAISDTLSGAGLTGFPDSLIITSPSTDFEVSNDNVSWGQVRKIYYSSAALSPTPFYVRFTPQSGGAKTGNVTVSGGGVSPSLSITVSGNGLDPVGPYPYSVTGSTYTQNFNGLPATGSFTLPNVGPFYISGTPIFGGGVVGWQFGTILGNPARFNVDNGSLTTGSAYSYGSSASSDRALGSTASGTFVPNIGAVIQNNTSDILTTVTISFTGEQWRRGSASANSLFFSYKVNASDISATPTTAVNALDFTAPTVAGLDVALDGNAAPNRTVISSQTFALDSNWLPGQNLVLRWDDVNDAANDDGIGIDDFSFSAVGPATPSRQDSTITFTNVSTFSLTANWLKGNGSGRIVIINTINSFTNPVDGISPSANANYSGAGEQVIYNGSGNSVNVTGLSTGTPYFFRVFSYNGFGPSSTYNTATATGNPNSQTTVAAAAPTRLVITSVNGGVAPAQNALFYVVVRSYDATHPQNVAATTPISLSLSVGTGVLGGTLTGSISIGTSTDTIFGVTYDYPETGVVLRSFRTSGDALADGFSAPFEVVGVASQLSFSGVASSGIINTNVGTFTVYALKDNLEVDVNYTGNITISIATGPGGGNLIGTLTRAAFAGIATFDSIRFNLAGTYTLQADANLLASAGTGDIIITNVPTLTELVVPQYIGSKTGASTNNTRTPIAICIQLNNLLPTTSYDLKAGIDTIGAPATAYGGGSLWTTQTTFATPTQVDTSAFTTNGSGSSGPVWIYIQPATTRFDAGQIHNVRVGYAVTGGLLPTTPNFVGAKTIKALDIAVSPRTATTTDDGAFVKGFTSSCIFGKHILVYDNVNGTGDPLFAYQARQATATNTPQSELPDVLNNVYQQAGGSTLGDWPAVVPIGANNPNGVRRVEARNLDNTIFSFTTDADGAWPGGARTDTISRRFLAILTLADAGMNSVSISSISSTAASCGANDGTATVAATGTGTLSYSWTNSPSTSNVATGLAAGNYTVTVTDSMGCSSIASVTVNHPAIATITANGPTTFCNGSSVTLSAGAGATQYKWSTNLPADTLQSLVVTTAGTYSVIVTSGSCIDTSFSIPVIVNNFALSGTVFSESMGTPGGTTVVNSYSLWQNTAPVSFKSTTASQSDVRSTGASSGYAGSTGGGNVFFTQSLARNFIISGINTLNYSNLMLTFGLRRDGGTTADPMIVEVSTDDITYDTLVITQPSVNLTWTLDTAVGSIPATANLRIRFSKGAAGVSSYRIDDVKITGSTNTISLSYEGSSTVCASSGGVRLTSTIPINNVWSPNSETTRSILVTTTGVYSVTSTGSTGCPATSASVSVTVNPNPSISFTSITNASCFGDTNGSITSLATGGTGTINNSWNTSPVQSTPVASNLGAGTYTLTVSDVNSCTDKDSATVTQPTVVTVTAAVTNDTVCSGTSVSLSSSGTTTAGLTFTNATPVFIPDSTIANGIVPVTSSVSVSGVNTNSLSNGIANVKINSLTHSFVGDLVLRLVGPDGRSLILCDRRGGSGNNFTNTVFSSSSATNISSASAPFTGTFKPDTASTGAAAFGIFNGLDPNGSWQLYVSDNAPPDSGFINSWSITFNSPIDFSWTSTPAGFIDSVKSPGSVTPSSLGSGTVTYHVVATNLTTGCFVSSDVNVQVNPSPTVLITDPAIACAPNTVNLTLPAVTAGSTAGLSYTYWNNLAATSAVVDPTAVGTGTYYIKGTESINGCSDIKPVQVTVLASCGVTLNVKVLIQGYYIGGGQMTPVLFAQVIPGATDAMVDTITIETRDAADFSLVDSYTSIVDTGGKVTGTMSVASIGTAYYVAVRHRNSIFTCSANPVLMQSVTSYDFRLSADSSYGSPLPAGGPYKQLYDFGDGYFGMYNGDVNNDEYIDTGDVTPIDNDNISGLYQPGGYWLSDINGDGYVDTGDVTPADNNNLAGIYSQHP